MFATSETFYKLLVYEIIFIEFYRKLQEKNYPCRIDSRAKILIMHIQQMNCPDWNTHSQSLLTQYTEMIMGVP